MTFSSHSSFLKHGMVKRLFMCCQIVLAGLGLPFHYTPVYTQPVITVAYFLHISFQSMAYTVKSLVGEQSYVSV